MSRNENDLDQEGSESVKNQVLKPGDPVYNSLQQSSFATERFYMTTSIFDNQHTSIGATSIKSHRSLGSNNLHMKIYNKLIGD